MSGLFGRLRAGLSRSSKALGDSLGGLLGGSRLSAEQLDALEDLLIMADLGVEAAGNIVAALRQRKDLKIWTKPNCAPRLRRNRRIAGTGPARA